MDAPAEKNERVELRDCLAPRQTPKHISLLITDKSRSAEPWFLPRGHALKVGDLGRTEPAVSAEVGVRTLFDTLQKLRCLRDCLEVLPGAFAGSVRGHALRGKLMSTVGLERRFKRAFGITDRNEFIAHMPRRDPDSSNNAKENRVVNLGRLAERVGPHSHER